MSMSKTMNIIFNKNEDNMKLLVSAMKQKKHIVEMGGGQKNINKQHEKGKLTARERLNKIFDTDSTILDLGTFAAEGLYGEYGGCPSAGVVVQIGYINGKICIVVANDSTVKSGAWFPMTAKKKPSCTRNMYEQCDTDNILG